MPDTLLEGEMTVYVDGEVFSVTAGEFVFLPRQTPHAFLIESEQTHVIVMITPGGFVDAVNKMNAPAERMEFPTDKDVVTYATADLTETMKIFEKYEVRLLTPDEVRTVMPQYPSSRA